MDSNIIRSWNNQTIRQREDGYLSATDMCKACGKLFADWYRLKSTTEYLQVFESDMGIPISQLVEVKKGNTSQYEQGTWVHRRVAIRLAQWLSPKFAVQVDEWVEELLLTGKVDITETKPKALPTSYEKATCVNGLVSALSTVGYTFDNPRFQQPIKDLVGDILGLTQPTLPESTEQWYGVAERAEQLGYPVNLVVKHRSQLGKWVKSFQLERKQERRLCNGTQRLINLYLVTDELDKAITEFMDAKIIEERMAFDPILRLW